LQQGAVPFWYRWFKSSHVRHLILEIVMSPELEEFLESTYKLRKALEPVLPKEAIDYILELIVKDSAHRKCLKLTE
jgi:hypothetical protein